MKNEDISSLYNVLSELIKRSSENPFTANPRESRPEPIENNVLEYIENYLEEIGINTKRVGITARPNLVAEIGSGKKRIVFNGHMDTVPAGHIKNWKVNPFSAHREGDKVFGRGAADMKGGLAVYLKLAESIVKEESNLNVKVQFQFVVDEEVGASSPFGTKLLVEKGYVGDFVIIAEPGIKKISNGHKGVYRFRVVTRGESVHSGSREWEERKRGRNAILEMVKVVERVQELEKKVKICKNNLFPGRKDVITFPTVIRGGSGINLVPDFCEAFGDCRLVSLTPEEIRDMLERCLEEVDGYVESIISVPPVVCDPKNEYIKLLKNVAEKELKRKISVEPSGPASDLWHFIIRGIPGVCFGPEGGNVHGSNEWVSLSSMSTILRIYKNFVLLL